MSLSASERIMAEAGIIALVGVAFALLNLFNPSDMALGARLAFWIGGFLAGWVVVRVLAGFGSATAKLIGLAPVWGYALAIPLSGAIIAWAVLWSQGGPQLAASESFARIWPSTIMVGIGFFALFYVLYARVERAPVVAEAAAFQETKATVGIAKAAIHEKLPAGFPAVLALSVEDHYVRAHAEARSEMVLMPLNEACDLMPGDEGERVHRSWWVARSAVVSHRREGRDVKLILANDLEVPVSRDKVKDLREAGWLS